MEKNSGLIKVTIFQESMPAEKIIKLRKRSDEIEAEKQEILEKILNLEKLSLKQNKDSEYLGIKALSQTPKSPQDKIKLFHRLFVCRTSVFPKLWINQNKNTKGYSPACNNEWIRGVCNKPRIKCSDCNNQNFIPLNEHIINDHLT